LPEGRDIVEDAKRLYLRDNVAFFIDVLGERDVGKRVVGEVVEVMRGQEHGLLLSVFTRDGGDRKEEKASVRISSKRYNRILEASLYRIA
jgi:hypothetical protein